MPLNRRSFLHDDEAVSEVIGYILSFALSAVFLLIALSSFWSAQQNTDSVVTAAEMNTIANRVASRVVDAGLVAQQFPNAHLDAIVDLPQAVNNHPYSVQLTDKNVIVATKDGLFKAYATTFKLDALAASATNPVIVKDTTVESSNQRLTVHLYDDASNSNKKTISILG